MSEPSHDGDKRASFIAQSSLVTQLPDERLAVLRRMDFAVLRDGEISGVKAAALFFYGLAASSLIGLIGILETIDWQAPIKAAQFIWADIEGVIFVSFLAIAIVFHIRIHRTNKSSAYSILMKRLDEHFSTTESTSEGEPTSVTKDQVDRLSESVASRKPGESPN